MVRVGTAVVLVYLALSFAVFGSVTRPFMLLATKASAANLTAWAVPLGLAAVIWLAIRFWFRPRPFTGALVASAVAFGVAILGTAILINTQRDRAITEFGADRVVVAPFLPSLRTPGEMLHAAALRDCVGYGWSYRDMAFYPMPAAEAERVLPAAWREECGGFREE